MLYKICAFASWELFAVASELGFIDAIYSEADFLRVKGQLENLREDHFMDVVFEENSKLENEVWIQKVSSQCSWSFNAV